MCLLIFAHRVSPAYPLLVAANRDEFHARPTAPCGFWEEYPGLLAGRDLQLGGTWMGLTRTGRFAAVTNFRDPSRTAPAPRSRGELPLDFLTGSMDPRSYLGAVAARAGDYAGFNLLLGDGESVWYFTNSDALDPACLPPGVYGLSNARLDTPWPKVTLGKARMQALLATGEITHDALAAVVGDRQLADWHAPGNLKPADDMSPVLSAQFIVTESYGTRARTTLWTDARQRASWREQGFDAAGELQSLQLLEFSLRAG